MLLHDKSINIEQMLSIATQNGNHDWECNGNYYHRKYIYLIKRNGLYRIHCYLYPYSLQEQCMQKQEELEIIFKTEHNPYAFVLRRWIHWQFSKYCVGSKVAGWYDLSAEALEDMMTLLKSIPYSNPENRPVTGSNFPLTLSASQREWISK